MAPRPPIPPLNRRSTKQLEKRKNRPRSCYLCRQKDHKAAECPTNKKEPIIDPDDEFKEPAWDPRYRIPEESQILIISTRKDPEEPEKPKTKRLSIQSGILPNLEIIFNFLSFIKNFFFNK